MHKDQEETGMGNMGMNEMNARIRELEQIIKKNNREIRELKKLNKSGSAAYETDVNISANPYKMIFDKMMAVALVIDPANGRIIEANEFAANFYGYTVEELKRKNISDLNSLPDGVIREGMTNVIKNKNNYFLFPHRLKNGDIRNVEVFSAPVPLDSRNLLVSIVNDATKRLESEEKFIESLRKNQIILNAIPDTVFTVDGNGTFIDVIPEYDSSYIPYGTDLTNRNIAEIGLDSPSLDRALTTIRKTLESGQPQQDRYVLHGKSGKLHYLDCRFIPLNKKEVVGIARDVSDTITREEKIVESEKRYHLLFETIPDPVIVYDKETDKVLDVNQAACDLYGYTKAEFLKLFRRDISLDFQKTAYLKSIGYAEASRINHKKKNGVPFYVDIKSSTVEMNGRYIHVAIMRDLSPTINMESETRNYKKQLEELTKENTQPRPSTAAGKMDAHDGQGIGDMIIEHLTKGVYFLNTKTDDILYVNSAFCRLWNLEHLQQIIMDKRLKNYDIMKYCMGQVDDIHSFYNFMSISQSSTKIETQEKDFVLIDGKKVNISTRPVYNSLNVYIGRLFVFC